MSQLLVQFNNGANWQPFYNGTYSATPVQGSARYVPIPPHTLPIAADYRILAAKATSADVRPSWKTGGWLTPIIDLSATPLRDARWNQMRVPLRTSGILILPEFAQSYRLRYDVPKWIQSVTLDIWQYIGPIDDSTEKLIREKSQDWLII
jgi:hypothetical protein